MPITLNTGVTAVSPSVAIAPSMQVPDLQSLQGFVFGDYSHLSGKAILNLTNSTTIEVNNVCLVNLRAEERVYLANTSALPNDPVGEGQPYLVPPQELINTLSHRSLPPHELKLRLGCRVTLLRYWGVKSGLCNDTMMEVLQFYNNSIKVKILNGVRTGRVPVSGEAHCSTPILSRKLAKVPVSYTPCFQRDHQQVSRAIVRSCWHSSRQRCVFPWSIVRCFVSRQEKGRFTFVYWQETYHEEYCIVGGKRSERRLSHTPA